MRKTENHLDGMLLSLNGDTFYALKKDFDDVLNRTIGNMQVKGASDAKVTLALSISIAKGFVNINGINRDYNKPSFKHEVSSVLQIKDKATGQLTGEYVMVWDDDEEKFILQQVQDGQTSIFDADYETCDSKSDGDHLALLEAAVDSVDAENDDEKNAFDVMMEYVDRDLDIDETNGVYTVRDANNHKDVILSSGCEDGNPFKLDATIAANHVGHKLMCYMYSDDGIHVDGIAINCVDCNETIFKMKVPAGCKYTFSEHELYDEFSEDILDDSQNDYGYDNPEDGEEV